MNKHAIENYKTEELLAETLRRQQEPGYLRQELAARGSGSFRPGSVATFLAISAVAAVFWMAARRRRGVSRSLM